MTKRITPQRLHAQLLDTDELALVDVREEGQFAESHLLLARSIPLSRLEILFASLVPRRGARVVLCDAGERLAEAAAARLDGFGYRDVSVLDGGVGAWGAAGFELFSGMNVPSKAFGELVEHNYQTPSIEAEELNALLDAQADVVVLDSRPFDEYHVMSIPNGRCVPGGELVYRLAELAPSSDTLVVVNCAGRTRSILGAQSLINAGVANRVVALKNGTMGWHLAGFELEHGQARYLPQVTPATLDAAKKSANRIATQFGIKRISSSELDRWRDEAEQRTLYVLDVRSPEEFSSGHLPDAVSAPGGQLVQATDRYVGTLRSRIVLVDDNEVRATMAASWLLQMGWSELAVLAGGISDHRLERGARSTVALGLETASVPLIDAEALHARLRLDDTLLLDLSSSVSFRKRHIEGARHALRLDLEQLLPAASGHDALVLTSEDGLLARVSALGAQALYPGPVYALEDGNAGWENAGFPLLSGTEGMDAEPSDVWLRPYDRNQGVEEAMQRYLAWEVGLVDQVERDGTAKFRLPER